MTLKFSLKSLLDTWPTTEQALRRSLWGFPVPRIGFWRTGVVIIWVGCVVLCYDGLFLWQTEVKQRWARLVHGWVTVTKVRHTVVRRLNATQKAKTAIEWNLVLALPVRNWLIYYLFTFFIKLRKCTQKFPGSFPDKSRPDSHSPIYFGLLKGLKAGLGRRLLLRSYE